MFDSHFHFDPSITPAEGLIASMDEAGIERAALIPVVCSEIKPLPRPIATALPVFRRLIHGPGGSLHRFVLDKLYAPAVKGGDIVELFGAQYKLFAQPDNNVVMEAVAAHPKRFVGWVWVNPAGPVSPVAEAERCLKQPGMIGVKAHPFWHNFAVEKLIDVAALCAERGKPMLLHLGPGHRGDFKLLPGRFPQLKIIYAHCGIPYGHAVTAYAEDRDNVFVDMASLEYTDLRIYRAVLATAGHKKLLFGSDGPYFHHHNGRYNYRPHLDLLPGLGLGPDELKRVTSDNFREIIGEI